MDKSIYETKTQLFSTTQSLSESQQSNVKIESQKVKQSSQASLWPPICQICGAQLKVDNSIEQITETQYKQLTCSYLTTRDDVETVTTISDTGIDNTNSTRVLSVIEMTQNSANGCNNSSIINNTNRNQNNDLSTIIETNNMKSMPPRNFYSFNTSISIDYEQNCTNTNELIPGWSTKINTISGLFDLMSLNTNIDHPLCEECADQLINQLDIQCKIIQKEQCEYTNLINKLNEQILNSDELEQLENELKLLENEECKLLEQLESYENDEIKLEEEINKKLNEEIKLNEDEERYLIEYSNYKRALFKLEEKQSSLDNQLKHTKSHFNRLRTTNVLNAAFHIWHSGPFGTINYFRLGRLPDTPVEWDEINAALGQVALLLYSLARTIRLEFKRFKLIPFGNNSYIEVIDNVPNLNVKKGDQLHMYGVGGFKYYFEWDKKFDIGMVAFLDCLQQFEDHIKSLDVTFSMPYPINGHKLEDKKTASSYSIKCHLNSHEEWTKALKYMLTNLKWSLAWVVSQYD